jgi:phosphoglycerol transferase MdoB-like AlkP superfamily enzyme
MMTPKLKYLYALVIFQLIVYTCFRILFLGYNWHELNSSAVHLLPQVLLLGFKFDLRLALGLLIPAFILIHFNKKILTIVYSLLFTIVTSLYVLDAGYFNYLKARLNATVIQFLKNPIISFQMVRESYPWFWLLLLIVIFGVGFYFFLSRIMEKILFEQKVEVTLQKKIGRMTLFIFVFVLGLYGSVHMYPLRWSEAFLSPDPFTSNLALNPILYMIDTYTFRTSDFDEENVHRAYPTVAKFLGIEKYDEKKLNFVREFTANPERMKQHPNVVVIIMESMAYYKTGLGGSKVNPTPYLDSLAKSSLLFENFFTPTVATARSVFAAVTSLPDISKVQTGTRNPFVVNQHAIMGEIKDYEKFYFLGGSANWGNIRGILSYNIPNLHVYEEGSYKAQRVDVWGISDLDLFKESINGLGKIEADIPFISIIQSAGFHRPYTIPKNSDDFKAITISDKELRDFGFESLAEYNAMRLQDYSLGRFFEMAKKQKWYDNTIFMVFGDHGLPHNNAINVPDWTKSLADHYHVPYLIHSPRYIKPGVETKIASEMDVMPTMAGLMGVPYKTRSFGRDLFNPQFDSYRAAFSYNWYAPFNLTLIDQDFYFEYIPYNNNGKLVKHSMNPLDKYSDENLKDKFPEKYQEMEQLSKGLYESAKYLLYHNAHMY